MPEIVKETLINASAETVWTLMVQHLKYPEKEGEHGPDWDKLVIKNLKGKALTPNRTGVGVRTRWFYKFHFYAFTWDDEVIEWEERKRITWKAISTWEMVDSFITEPAGNATKLTYAMDYTPPYWVLGGLWYRLFVHQHLERHLEYTLRQMKRSAEAVERFKARSGKK